MKTPYLVLIGLGILSLLVVSAFLISRTLFQIGGECRPIYCADYEFICCGEKLSSRGTTTVYTNPNKVQYWQCPLTGTKCELIVYGGNWCVGKQNCEQLLNIFGQPYAWKCQDQVCYSGQRSITLDPQQRVYPQVLTQTTEVTLDYKVYEERLAWCGSAACDPGVTGIPVQGASGCNFVTNWDVYNENGGLIRDVEEGKDFQITVPIGNCYLSQRTRHICGDTCEKCDTDADCRIGHTLVYNGKGAECSTGQLQVYGCKRYGDKPIDEERQVMPWERESIWNFGSRCDVIQTIPVQCCPGTESCGPNAFCDPETFTCKSTAECTEDWECGVATTCTYENNKPAIKGKKCQLGKCVSFVKEYVSCCYDTDCASGWFCGSDYKCYEEVDGKDTCPFECCIDDPNYRDRPCPPGEECIDHKCVSLVDCLLEGEICGAVGQKPCCGGLTCEDAKPIVGGGRCMKEEGIKIPWNIILSAILGLIGFIIPIVSVKKKDRGKGVVIGLILGLIIGLGCYYIFTYVYDLNELIRGLT